MLSSREPALWSLLLAYTVCSLSYYLLLGLVGKAYHPLAAFQVYAIALPVWFMVGCVALRKHLPRMWPPTKHEFLSAIGAVIILTSETVALLMPSSLVAIVAGKGGCLAFPDPTDTRPWHKKMRLAALALIATTLASLHKPLRTLAIPLILACFYVFGHRLVLRAVRLAKGDSAAKPGFFGAGQLVVNIITPLIALSLFNAGYEPASFADWRLWFVALASLGCGLIGLRIKLHRTSEGIVFPAYRAASLCCALGASAARGESLHWSGWCAVALALGVVLWASAEPSLRRFGRWLSIGWAAIQLDFGLVKQESVA